MNPLQYSTGNHGLAESDLVSKKEPSRSIYSIQSFADTLDSSLLECL